MVDEEVEPEDDEMLLDVDEEDDLYNEDSQNSKPAEIILEKIDTQSKYRIKKIPCIFHSIIKLINFILKYYKKQ